MCSRQVQVQPELCLELEAGLEAEQVPAWLAAQVQLDELSAEVVRAHSAEAQEQPVLLGLAQQVQPEAQVQPALSELARQVQPELFAELERAHSAEHIPAGLAAQL